MSEADYRNHVQALQRLQSNIVATRAAVQGLQQAAAYAKQVNEALLQYLTWGHMRIARQSLVQVWWDRRIKNYSACLARIKPLAEDHVSSWQWQSYVLNVENDAYDRKLALTSVQNLAAEGVQKLTNLNGMIVLAKAKSEAATQRLHAACPHALDPARCDVLWNEWTAQEPSMVSSVGIVALHAIAPQVELALKADVGTATASKAKLDAIARQIQQIYQKAQN